MAAKIEVYRDTTDRWRFRVRAGNGEIVAVSSESYKRASDARRGAKDMQATVGAIGALNVLAPRQPADVPPAPLEGAGLTESERVELGLD
jgi:uncharacterized protein YegP (UPF0339 family)